MWHDLHPLADVPPQLIALMGLVNVLGVPIDANCSAPFRCLVPVAVPATYGVLQVMGYRSSHDRPPERFIRVSANQGIG